MKVWSDVGGRKLFVSASFLDTELQQSIEPRSYIERTEVELLCDGAEWSPMLGSLMRNDL